MSLTLIAICIAVLCLLIAMRIKRTRDRDEIEQHSITPEAARFFDKTTPELATLAIASSGLAGSCRRLQRKLVAVDVSE